jgi:hypothetical protein
MEWFSNEDNVTLDGSDAIDHHYRGGLYLLDGY